MCIFLKHLGGCYIIFYYDYVHVSNDVAMHTTTLTAIRIMQKGKVMYKRNTQNQIPSEASNNHVLIEVRGRSFVELWYVHS